MIEMWQEERGKPYYRFQTKYREAANKMKRRNKFKLSSLGLNCNWWVFVATFNRPDIAQKALKALAGNVVKFDKKDDVFYAEINMSKKEKQAA